MDSSHVMNRSWENGIMRIIKATFDGETFCPDEPLDLPPGTRVTLTVHPEDPEAEPVETALALSPAAAGDGSTRKKSFADAIERHKVRGPRDWSERVDYYLGQDPSGDGE
jgi:hypothetical protein